jgi:hypothetical protein
VLETGAGNDPHCDLIGKLFGLQVRVVGEDPNMPKLVRDRSLELVVAQRAEKIGVDTQCERLLRIRRGLDRHHQSIARHNRYRHCRCDLHSRLEILDQRLEPPFDHSIRIHTLVCEKTGRKKRHEKYDLRDLRDQCCFSQQATTRAHKDEALFLDVRPKITNCPGGALAGTSMSTLSIGKKKVTQEGSICV